MKAFFEKHREVILYLIFGVLTTVVGFGSYFAFLKIGEAITGLSDGDGAFYLVRLVAQILQWILAVLFAYVTNRVWVFRSDAHTPGAVARELSLFAASRLLSLGLDTLVTFGCVALLGAVGYRPFRLIVNVTSDVVAKCVASVFVIVANYVLSKWLVFRKKKSE